MLGEVGRLSDVVFIETTQIAAPTQGTRPTHMRVCQGRRRHLDAFWSGQPRLPCRCSRTHRDSAGRPGGGYCGWDAACRFGARRPGQLRRVDRHIRRYRPDDGGGVFIDRHRHVAPDRLSDAWMGRAVGSVLGHRYRGLRSDHARRQRFRPCHLPPRRTA